MPPQRGTAILSDTRQLTDKFLFMEFEMKEPSTLKFEAGQYVSIGFPDNPVRRPYSIASIPSETHGFDLLVDLSPQGVGTKFLSSIKPGTQVDILGPIGMFTMAKGEAAAREKAVIFVATGSGIAPLRSMALDLLQTQNDAREIWLYWGLRYENDIFWQDEFQELAQAFPNFHFHITLSKASSEWPLCRGRVTDRLTIHELPTDAGYYLCGNKAMIEDVTTVLSEKHIAKEMIHHEKFY